jgi:hypothetical protein
MIARDFAFFPLELRPETGRQSLYMVGPFPTPVDDGLLIEKEHTLTVDGAMNSLYDREVLPFIGTKRLALRVLVQGACRITLIHRSADGAEVEYGSAISTQAVRMKRDGDVKGEIQKFDLEFSLMNSEQTFGRWFFRIQALRSEIKLLDATWLVREADLGDIVPAFVICTFKREAQVAENVRRLNALLSKPPTPRVSARPRFIKRFGLSRDDTTHQPQEPVATRRQPLVSDFGILVVDNAGTLSPASFGSSRVHLIRQRNVGGAGGFGRGIYEAVEARVYTHVIMLDDDADISDSSIARMLNLLRLTKDPELFIGGLQLDTYSPCQLADAGAYWTPERFERPIGRLPSIDLGTDEGKDGLARSYNSNFNGWWLFGGRIESFQAYGMPLPCFVHLDDVEFGVRIQLAGARTVTVPGVAVWHEPFYAKVEGWFAYYNIRNELIRLSAQTPIVLAQTTARPKSVVARQSRERVASVSRQLRGRYRDFVNTYQYGSAVLLAEAIEDFSSGSTLLLNKDAEELHAKVMAVYKDANANYRTTKTLPPGFVSERPSQGQKLYRIAQIYSRNGNRVGIPTRVDRNGLTMFANRRDINWKWIKARQAWGYPDPGTAAYHIYKFDRDLYARANARFNKAIKQFEREARNAQASWSDAYEELISYSFWSKMVKTF